MQVLRPTAGEANTVTHLVHGIVDGEANRETGFVSWRPIREDLSRLLGEDSVGRGQRGREVWSMKTQYLSEEVMIP